MEHPIHVLAVVSSFIALVMLCLLVPRMTGVLQPTYRFLLLGIFFSVFIHSIAELANTIGLIPDKTLPLIMGTLLTVGSICFCAGGWRGLKAVQDIDIADMSKTKLAEK